MSGWNNSIIDMAQSCQLMHNLLFGTITSLLYLALWLTDNCQQHRSHPTGTPTETTGKTTVMDTPELVVKNRL